MGYLSRMTQWKVSPLKWSSHLRDLHLTDELLAQIKLSLSEDASVLDDTAKAKLKLGLFSYPVLQAADVLLYRSVLDDLTVRASVSPVVR
jgi:tryptophanyl-tRNA synthetase